MYLQALEWFKFSLNIRKFNTLLHILSIFSCHTISCNKWQTSAKLKGLTVGGSKMGDTGPFSVAASVNLRCCRSDNCACVQNRQLYKLKPFFFFCTTYTKHKFVQTLELCLCFVAHLCPNHICLDSGLYPHIYELIYSSVNLHLIHADLELFLFLFFVIFI